MSAATLFSLAGPNGPVASPGSFSYNFNAPAGAAALSFVINGYASLDGQNCCTDIFTLNLNGTDILSGTYAMGGGGTNITFFAPVGSVITPVQFSFFGGGKTDISTSLALISGSNTLTFSYAGAAQGLGDEGWGLSNISVTSAIPEPATWTMLITGFGLVGFASRRRTALAA